MAHEFVHSNVELSRMKSGLVFDAEGVTLIARFSDELSAYRIKKTWKEVLAGYFLLEYGRDYEMSVLSAPENNYFVLSCFFISACGRYAFWRLINDQAPEAELKLSQSPSPAQTSVRKKQPPAPSRCEVPTPKVLSGEDKTEGVQEEGVLFRMLSHVKKVFLL